MKSTVVFEDRVGRFDRPGRTALISLIPTGAFVAFDAIGGLSAAIVAASVASLGLLVIRRRRGNGVGILIPLSLGFVIAKAVAGVVTDSQVVYFGVGLVLSALVALVVGGTAFTRKPLASYAIPLFTPYRRLTPDHPAYKRVSSQVTAAWALAELGMVTWEARHLTTASASGFAVTRSLVAWPLMGVVIFFLIFYVRFKLDRYEYSLARPVDQ
ncbi:MAG: hypothetical protein R3246_17715, partial [Acidimicrobiia bacterium]|nr:hypothetical protein [Acidimicrobiia bacterium]